MSLGGELGCKQLAQNFYSRVASSQELKPLFPGKNLRCATEEFAAFLIQFLDGDPEQTQYRWWLSLRESHARFKISEEQRTAWLSLMVEAIKSHTDDANLRATLWQFFTVASRYILGHDEGKILNHELARSWQQQLDVDRLVTMITDGQDREAVALTTQYVHRPAVCIGILAKMMATGRPDLIEFVIKTIDSQRELLNSRYNGRTLLHHATEGTCLPVVHQLLNLGVDPNIEDSGRHTPLYRTARTKPSSEGALIVSALVCAGADVNHTGGVNRSTALHQAARFGDLGVAKQLLDSGANIAARDKNGLTPLDRAIRCRRSSVAAILMSIQ